MKILKLEFYRGDLQLSDDLIKTDGQQDSVDLKDESGNYRERFFLCEKNPFVI